MLETFLNRLWNNHPREMEEALLTESFLSGLSKVLRTVQGKNVPADGKATRSTAQNPNAFLFSAVAVVLKTKPN